MHTIDDFRRKIAEERQTSNRAAEDFVRAAVTDDPQLLFQAMSVLQSEGQVWRGWKRAFRKLQTATIHPAFPERFLALWIEDGDGIRSDVNDDLALMSGLRKILPRYDGGPVTLYRGDSAFNRRRRTYGPSWSADCAVADTFARTGLWRTCEGGSVLLETLAPPEAIICVPSPHLELRGEQEYIVDRRRLRFVKVLDRFAQLTFEELEKERERARQAAEAA